MFVENEWNPHSEWIDVTTQNWWENYKSPQRKCIHGVLSSTKWWNSLPITNSEWIDIATQTWWENCKSPQRKCMHDVLSSTKWWNSLPIRKIDSKGTIFRSFCKECAGLMLTSSTNMNTWKKTVHYQSQPTRMS